MASEEKVAKGQEEIALFAPNDLASTDQVKNSAQLPADEKNEVLNAAGEESTGDQGVYINLGRKLKESYEDLVRQPVPDKFRQLLDELERRENGQ